MQRGNKNYEWSDRCFNSQEELNADAVYTKQLETFNDVDKKTWMQLSECGNQIKVIGAI